MVALILQVNKHNVWKFKVAQYPCSHYVSVYSKAIHKLWQLSPKMHQTFITRRYFDLNISYSIQHVLGVSITYSRDWNVGLWTCSAFQKSNRTLCLRARCCQSDVYKIKFIMKPVFLNCNGARVLVASLSALVCVCPFLPPRQRVLHRTGHSIPIVSEYPIRLELRTGSKNGCEGGYRNLTIEI